MWSSAAIQAHRLAEIAAAWRGIRARQRLGIFTEIEELDGFDFHNRMMADAIKRRDRRARGLCTRCGDPSPDRSLCRVCMVLQGLRSKHYRESLKRQGVCIQCATRAATAGLATCQRCRDRRNGRRRNAEIQAVRQTAIADASRMAYQPDPRLRP